MKITITGTARAEFEIDPTEYECGNHEQIYYDLLSGFYASAVVRADEHAAFAAADAVVAALELDKGKGRGQ